MFEIENLFTLWYFWLLLLSVVVIVFWSQGIILKTQTYWKDIGVLQVGVEVTGSLIQNIINKTTFFETDSKIYAKMKQLDVPYLGIYEIGSPTLVLRDLNLIKLILVKNFDHFVNRRSINLEHNDPHFHKILFNMENEEWKQLRSKLSPTFTTGKIRRQFNIFDTSGKKLCKFFETEIKALVKNPESSIELDISEGLSKFTMDVIASSAFGVDSRAFDEKLSIFEQMAKKMQVSISISAIMKMVILLTLPKLARLLKLRIFNAEADNFFTQVILTTLKTRSEDGGQKRDDFLQLMIESRNGLLKTEPEELDVFEKEATIVFNDKPSSTLLLDDDTIVANSILFMLGGFDTTHSLLAFMAYQLSLNPEIQEKLAQEIKSVLDENNGVFTHDSVCHMKLLDEVMNETLRMYPPNARLERKCTQDYSFPNENWSVKKGQLIIIPTMSIHHDPNIYPNPDRFDPERFSDENKTSRNPYAFLPFGHGPRNCIGMRFAHMESKLAIAHLVRKFVLEPCSKTDIPMKFLNTATLKPKNGMWLNIKIRNY